jgi:toxin YxiD
VAPSTFDLLMNPKFYKGFTGPEFGESKSSSLTSREITYPKVETYEQARNQAFEILGDLGADSQPFIGSLEKSAGYLKVIGRKSADGLKRWRLDYSPEKGCHINIEDFSKGKGAKFTKICIPFEGNEYTFISLLKHLQK